MKKTTSNPTLWTEMTDDLSETVNGGSNDYYYNYRYRCNYDYNCDYYERPSC